MEPSVTAGDTVTRDPSPVLTISPLFVARLSTIFRRNYDLDFVMVQSWVDQVVHFSKKFGWSN